MSVLLIRAVSVSPHRSRTAHTHTHPPTLQALSVDLQVLVASGNLTEERAAMMPPEPPTNAPAPAAPAVNQVCTVCARKPCPSHGVHSFGSTRAVGACVGHEGIRTTGITRLRTHYATRPTAPPITLRIEPCPFGALYDPVTSVRLMRIDCTPISLQARALHLRSVKW